MGGRFKRLIGRVAAPLFALGLLTACTTADAADPTGDPARLVVTTFTPTFDAVDASPVYEMPDGASWGDEDAAPYGEAPFGRYTDDGEMVEVWGRIVTGAAFDDETTFDPGAGAFYLPLPVPPDPSMTGPVGEGQIVIGADHSRSSLLSTFKVEIDPGLDYPFGLVDSPGERADVAWLFLDGTGHELDGPGWIVGADTPARATDTLILAFHLRYLRA